MKDPQEQRSERIRAGVNRAYKSVALQRCLVPDCNTGEPVINAHSIQERRILGLISEKKHVYMFQSKTEGQVLDLVGIHKATRFTGFCKTHDNELFDLVDLGDDREVDIENQEHIVRLSLRAVGCEYWKKLNSQKFYRKIFELASANKAEEIAEFLNIEVSNAQDSLEYARVKAKLRLAGTDVAVQRIGRLFFSLLDQIRRQKYHLSKTCAFSIGAAPTVAAAAHFPPEFDLQGNRLALKTIGEDLPEVTLNILPTPQGTLVMFLWHRRFESHLRPFFSEIKNLPDEDKACVLGQMLLRQCENVAISPRLVDKWEERERAQVLDLFNSTLEEAIPYDRDWSVDLFEVVSC